MKTCSKCKQEKEFSAFGKLKSARDGHKSWCRACNCEVSKAYQQRNKEKANTNARRYRAKHGDRHSAVSLKWSKANPEKCRAACAKRRSIKLQATPKWFDEEKVKNWYALAQLKQEATGIPMQVDHVIPLAGKLVCGLHVHTNLQILTQSENAAKGNRHV